MWRAVRISSHCWRRSYRYQFIRLVQSSLYMEYIPGVILCMRPFSTFSSSRVFEQSTIPGIRADMDVHSLRTCPATQGLDDLSASSAGSSSSIWSPFQ
ncbi:hypothetical protein CY34DRAFT_234058 [Suillus luteus UH-Slu-Lm8-n1]|uniref:Uncharacterized protein n=1 Tax=Suillus luteus UH-Slu-Lm8-n1 TaxID=930992 RepID=A0A0D0BCQ7_9AGAM|nr:hypothetical protein CY34DRAFT_234058 [Suillus luteus UH-Slu-Lm8-n1]